MNDVEKERPSQRDLFEKIKEVKIVGGGMGLGVSSWRLARAISLAGEGKTAGTVTLTAIAWIAARRLAQGDAQMYRALMRFHLIAPAAAEMILDHWWEKNSKIPKFTIDPQPNLEWLTIFGSFAEVWLASDDHPYPIGINILEKVQLPILPTLFGIMLAMSYRNVPGPTFLAVGAGLPTQIPDALESLLCKKRATYNIAIKGGKVGKVFDIEDLIHDMDAKTKANLRLAHFEKPFVLGIVSTMLSVKSIERSTKAVDGWIVENHDAGGHVSNPRKKKYIVDKKSKRNPVFGHEDEMDFAELKKIGKPYWVAGNWAYANSIVKAEEIGAQGIQVGSLTALSKESGYTDRVRTLALSSIHKAITDKEDDRVLSDADASPTGYTFQVLECPDTTSVSFVAKNFRKACTMGYLREIVVDADSRIIYRCPAEPEDQYVAKGGNIEDIKGRICLCRTLMAAIEDNADPPIITMGKHVVAQMKSFLAQTGFTYEDLPYSVSTLMQYLLGQNIRI